MWEIQIVKQATVGVFLINTGLHVLHVSYRCTTVSGLFYLKRLIRNAYNASIGLKQIL